MENMRAQAEKCGAETIDGDIVSTDLTGDVVDHTYRQAVTAAALDAERCLAARGAAEIEPATAAAEGR